MYCKCGNCELCDSDDPQKIIDDNYHREMSYNERKRDKQLSAYNRSVIESDKQNYIENNWRNIAIRENMGENDARSRAELEFLWSL